VWHVVERKDRNRMRTRDIRNCREWSGVTAISNGPPSSAPCRRETSIASRAHTAIRFASHWLAWLVNRGCDPGKATHRPHRLGSSAVLRRLCSSTFPHGRRRSATATTDTASRSAYGPIWPNTRNCDRTVALLCPRAESGRKGTGTLQTLITGEPHSVRHGRVAVDADRRVRAPASRIRVA
jgi:hypothetical protein